MNEDRKSIPKGLRVFTIEELCDGEEYQQKHYGWDFHEERVFIEGLFVQRFHFFLIVYSLFLTAVAVVKNDDLRTAILSIGILVTFLVFLTIWRAFTKMDITLKILHKLPHNVFRFINKETKAQRWKAFPWGVNRVIGFIIPLFCIASLLAGFLLSFSGKISEWDVGANGDGAIIVSDSGKSGMHPEHIKIPD